jgi:glycosyltransferase involved in cell wall biosynthesis
MLALARQRPDHPWFQAGQPPVIIGVGRLTRQKDFPTLIRAFAELRRRSPARLLILGEGEERPRREALAGELGVSDHVALPGFVENAMGCMAGSALFVLSSAWEGLPTVLIEALAAGTRVVSTDCPSGPREILQNGRLGALVPVGDAAALAQAMSDVAHGIATFAVDISRRPNGTALGNARALTLASVLPYAIHAARKHRFCFRTQLEAVVWTPGSRGRDHWWSKRSSRAAGAVESTSPFVIRHATLGAAAPGIFECEASRRSTKHQ